MQIDEQWEMTAVAAAAIGGEGDKKTGFSHKGASIRHYCDLIVCHVMSYRLLHNSKQPDRLTFF